MARGDDNKCSGAGETHACDVGAKPTVLGTSTLPEAGAVLGESTGEYKLEAQIQNILSEAAMVTADCGSPMELPPWFDWDKFRRGQQYFQRHYFAMFTAKLCGLLCVLGVPSILRVLCFTRQSSEPCSAFRRYVDTLVHMLDWYEGDLLEPGSKVYQSLSQVRARHAVASRRAHKAGLGLMSQLDMVLTQFGFMGFALLLPKKLGLTQSTSEVEGLVHFWRTVGYLLGIEDRFNLCREKVEDTKAICQGVLERVYRPALENPPNQFDEMARALVSGMKCMVPTMDYEAYLRFITEDLLSIHSDTKLPLYSRAILGLHRFVNKWCLGVVAFACFFRPLLNVNLRFAVFLTRRTPVLAYWRFGKAQVHCKN